MIFYSSELKLSTKLASPEIINLPYLLKVLRGVEVHAVEDFGSDELLVGWSNLRGELTWLLHLLTIVVLVLLVVTRHVPAGVDDGL